MDRYYRILGIPNNSSKEVIKKSYHEKIKALHPDKIHGTPLEATATLFTAEINEAYNTLMSQFMEINTVSNQSDQKNYIEKEIYVESFGLLKYTLSNNINVIINTIINQTKHTFPDKANEIPWTINPNLSVNVKGSMNKHNMNYSTATYNSGSKKMIAINKRAENEWFFSGYEINTGSPAEKSKIYNYNTRPKTNYSKQKNPLSVFVKIIIAIIVFGIIYQQFNNPQSRTNQTQIRTQNTRTAQVFATVTSCDWLNVRSSPSSVNNNNIIEAIRVNSRVEIIDKANNGWVRIRYNNGKTGYVHSNFLRQ